MIIRKLTVFVRSPKDVRLSDLFFNMVNDFNVIFQMLMIDIQVPSVTLPIVTKQANVHGNNSSVAVTTEQAVDETHQQYVCWGICIYDLLIHTLLLI